MLPYRNEIPATAAPLGQSDATMPVEKPVTHQFIDQINHIASILISLSNQQHGLLKRLDGATVEDSANGQKESPVEGTLGALAVSLNTLESIAYTTLANQNRLNGLA